tara:strand:+ start:831 stop:1163 length:333 start_codon:yes stop_codon:yes gene_type:complete
MYLLNAMPLPFKRFDYVEVKGERGYVNNICIANKSHLHPKGLMSYFTLTLEGTEHSRDRQVNVCIYRPDWSSVKLLKSYVEPTEQNNDLNLEGINTSYNKEHAEGTLLGI